MLFNKNKDYLKGKKGFIFDLDGTLVDSMHYWRSFDWNRMSLDDVYKVMMPLYKSEILPKADSVESLETFNKMGIKCCIATATRTVVCKPCIERLGILPHIEFILCNDDVKTSKLEPVIYFEAARLLGLEPSETVVFEDQLYTTKTAKNAGFTVVAIHDKQSLGDKDELKQLADDYIYSFKELLDVE